MKQENVAKHGARLRGWRAAGSAGEAAQMRHVRNEQSIRTLLLRSVSSPFV